MDVKAVYGGAKRMDHTAPAAQERNSNFQQGALGMQVRGESPAFLLPGKMCPERSEMTSLLYFFFF